MALCGSGLSEELYENQVKNITNIDISEVCVNHMKAKHEDKQEMQCEPPRTVASISVGMITEAVSRSQGRRWTSAS